MFITNPKEFEHYLSFIHSLVHCKKHSLNKCLKRQHDYLFEEFHWLLSDDSWDMLKHVALIHGDDNIFMAVLED
ncbi:hypothetical protein BACI9J_10043 [Bacillus altitudinis]|nr:hypothetical protein BACI9J_10043 [Bacillus altitudinis]